jgi:hypothetical protein
MPADVGSATICVLFASKLESTIRSRLAGGLAMGYKEGQAAFRA